MTLLIDYYGIRGDWPGYVESKKQAEHTSKAQIMNQATLDEVKKLFPDQNSDLRFIPYVSMYEIEATE